MSVPKKLFNDTLQKIQRAHHKLVDDAVKALKKAKVMRPVMLKRTAGAQLKKGEMLRSTLVLEGFDLCVISTTLSPEDLKVTCTAKWDKESLKLANLEGAING